MTNELQAVVEPTEGRGGLVVYDTASKTEAPC
jgi:hypothetical protein